jgi:hypothetical protein
MEMRTGYVLASWRMRDDDAAAGEQSEGDKPLLAVIEAVIWTRDAWAGQNLFGIRKIQAVFGEIALILGLVPLISSRSVVTFVVTWRPALT